MGEGAGVLAAVLSSGIGGASIGVTRFIAGTIDPLAIGAFRFGIGFMLLLPMALGRRRTWPGRGDWASVGALGLLFFGAFPVLFNASLTFTTAARGAMALSTLPLLTMVVAAVFNVEPLTRRKALGVFIAMTGVALALLTGFAEAPADAWRGDLADGLGCALHGDLQRCVEAVHSSFGSDRVHRGGNGRGCACIGACFDGTWKLRAHRGTWTGPVGSAGVSGMLRRCTDVLPLGICAATHHPYARCDLDIGQSDHCSDRWRAPRRGNASMEPVRRHGGRDFWHLDCDAGGLGGSMRGARRPLI